MYASDNDGYGSPNYSEAIDDTDSTTNKNYSMDLGYIFTELILAYISECQ